MLFTFFWASILVSPMLVRGLATLPAACSCGRRRNPWKVEKVVGRWSRWSKPKIWSDWYCSILIIEVICTESWDVVCMGTAWTILHWLPAICKIPDSDGRANFWLFSNLMSDPPLNPGISINWSLNGVVFLTSIDVQIHLKSLFCTSFPRHFPCAPSNPPLRTQPSAGCGEA